jgi:hypothetical protein
MYRESDDIPKCAVKNCHSPREKFIILINVHESGQGEEKVEEQNILGFCTRHATYMWDAINANKDTDVV